MRGGRKLFQLPIKAKMTTDASAGLEKALDLDFDVLAYGGVAVVDHDHGAVREIADALSLVFAFADDAELAMAPMTGKRPASLAWNQVTMLCGVRGR
jgi:hypothetical protein